MKGCYSDDYIAGDQIHTDITICNIEEPQQKYRLGTSSNRLHGQTFPKIKILMYIFFLRRLLFWAISFPEQRNSFQNEVCLMEK